MPLARTICGGWWADGFTLAFPLGWYCDDSMTRFSALQKASLDPANRHHQVDQPGTTVWYGRNGHDWRGLRFFDRNTRQVRDHAGGRQWQTRATIRSRCGNI